MEIFIENYVKKFIKSLEKTTTAKILRTIDLLEKFNFRLSFPHSKKIINNVFELRIRGQQEIRIFYTFQKDKTILFHAIIKKSNKIPKNELKNIINKLQKLDPI